MTYMAGRSGVVVKQRGDFKRFKRFLSKSQDFDSWLIKRLRIYGIRGVKMLQEATPKATGKTALRWHYGVKKGKNGELSLVFYNNVTSKSAPNTVALLVYGHATRNGKWVAGRDFVTPVIDPIFSEIQDEIKREVTTIGL